MTSPTTTPPRSVAVVTLGCARNEVDSEELAGRLAAQGWSLVEDPADADVALVNTCGFIESAKKDSIDAILEAADLKGRGRTSAVVAVGCLAERYGDQLAAELPEADAILGFDSYGDLSAHLTGILAGHKPAAHTPVDRRTLLPIAPVGRRETEVSTPGHASMAGFGGASAVVRTRLDGRPWAPLKIASGCDRRCAFCAIPSFRGSFVSRAPQDILAEAAWLAERGVREVLLVSENSTSYGKDLRDLRLLDRLLPQLSEVVPRVRVSYLQPAEIRPDLLSVMARTPGVQPYFDLSFQHASASVLRRMRRFGSSGPFLELVDSIRELAPAAGIRSNVIVGFPGETEADVDELADFLTRARLDVVGVFAYSDEDGTEAATYEPKVPADVIDARHARIEALVEELTSQRAEDRIGETVEVLVEEWDEDDPHVVTGRAAHQGPEVDGVCQVAYADPSGRSAVGSLILGTVTDAAGADLIVEPT